MLIGLSRVYGRVAAARRQLYWVYLNADH